MSDKPLSAAALRALSEAKTRRDEQLGTGEPSFPTEDGGPSGPEPTRFGDWERKGLARDF